MGASGAGLGCSDHDRRARRDLGLGLPAPPQPGGVEAVCHGAFDLIMVAQLGQPGLFRLTPS